MGTLFSEISRRQLSTRADQADPTERIGVLDALEARGDTRMILSEGVRLLCDEAEAVRSRAAAAVASVGTKEAAVAVIEVWDRFSQEGLAAAVEALAGLGREAVHAARTQLEHGDAAVRAAAVTVLGRIEARTVVADLAAALADRDPGVVRAAAQAIGNHRAAQCLDDLAVVYRRVPASREAVVEALARIGTPAAVQLIRRAVEDGDERVRQAATTALERAESSR